MGKDRSCRPPESRLSIKAAFPENPTEGQYPKRHLHGRRQSRGLRKGQAALLESLLPTITIPPPKEGGHLEPKRLFPQNIKALWLEIGFGAGEHLLHAAAARPDIGFIGSEFYRNGIAQFLSSYNKNPQPHIRIHEGDGRDLLCQMPPQSLERILLLFPDPWPKWRHRDRRFIQKDTAQTIARLLKPQGLFWVATDSPIVSAWTLSIMEEEDALVWQGAGVQRLAKASRKRMERNTLQPQSPAAWAKHHASSL